jgi:hypothetical protein
MDKYLLQLGNEIKRLKKENPEKLMDILSKLSEKEAEQVYYTWEFWCRPEQLVKGSPTWPENIIVYSAGRGY